jgi:hypothetical protein
MVLPLPTSTGDLVDLAQGTPQLFDVSGAFTGITLVRLLGRGGMSTVFLGELDRRATHFPFHERTPARVAVKFMQLTTERQLRQYNMDPTTLFMREEIALGHVMEDKPPTDLVVHFYGSGSALVQARGDVVRTLPWLALELVDGGAAGTSLTDRVRRTAGGVDPIRAKKLIERICEGVAILHRDASPDNPAKRRIIHRDLKPDNVLVAGPIDDETPKLADCGIARIEGIGGGTVNAMTAAYGGPEQSAAVAIGGVRNPLIGVWTDVHALAAVIWFILGGEEWCRSESDTEWHRGVRRSLRTAQRLHPAFMMDLRVLDRIDAVLARGAAHRMPKIAWLASGASAMEARARASLPSMFANVERYADVDAFAADLVPLLDEVSRRWRARAAAENQPVTAFRPTQWMRMQDVAKLAELARVKEIPQKDIVGTTGSFADADVANAQAGNAVFQPDGKVLARFGERLVYFVGNEPFKVEVPREYSATIGASKWVTRAPLGWAVIGASHVALVKRGAWRKMPLPVRASGGEVGEIQAAIGDANVFGVVTAETDESNGGPELWESSDGEHWSAPVVLPIGGDVHALADGPFGTLVVGSRGGKKARALFVGMNDAFTIFPAVNDKAPLRVAVCGAGKEAWAAGQGVVLRFDGGTATVEKSDASDAPIAMALDLVGVPWLVTERSVMRRHVEGNEGIWKAYYRRDPSRPPFVGIGFTPDGAALLDARGGGVAIEPHDIAEWRARAPTA